MQQLGIQVPKEVQVGTRPPGNRPFSSRSPIICTHGAAASSQPLVTQTAITILQRGGNAVDAAIAANAVQSLVEPMSCGIGGDLFAIVWDPNSESLVGYNGSGRSPSNLSRTQLINALPKRGTVMLFLII